MYKRQHYNCPVVAYYPELIAANVPSLKQTRFLDPYVDVYKRQISDRQEDRDRAA